MMRPIMIAVCAAAVSGCASTQRLASYSDGDLSAEAQIGVQGRRMNVSVHPRDDALLVQTTVADAAAGGLVEGFTFGLARGFRPDPRAIDQSLQAFVAPAGCSVSPVQPVGGKGVSYEGRYACPAGVDLRAMMREQRERLMQGGPLQPGGN